MVKATPTKSRTPFYGILLLLAVAGAGGIYYSVTSGKPKPIELPKGTPLPTAEGYLRGLIFLTRPVRMAGCRQSFRATARDWNCAASTKATKATGR